MTDIYLVLGQNYYYEKDLHGPFSSLDAAQSACQEHNGAPLDWVAVETYEHEEVPNGTRWWSEDEDNERIYHIYRLTMDQFITYTVCDA